MPTDNELFDRAVRAHRYMGARLPNGAPERHDGGLKALVDEAQRQIEAFRPGPTTLSHKPLPQIIVDYTDSSAVQAWAFPHEDRYFIAIPLGLVNTCLYIFGRLLSDPSVLPTVGDIRREQPHLPVLTVTDDWRDLDRSMQKAGLSWAAVLPKDPARQEVAKFLMFSSMTFLMGHEFRHIQAGHVDYGTGVLAVSSLKEMAFITDKAEVGLRRQALEMDADNFGIHGVFLRAVYGLEHTDDFAEPLRSIFSSLKSDLMTMVLLSCAGLLRILDPFHKPHPSRWEKQSHPPLPVRRFMLMASVKTFLQEEGKEALFGKPKVASPEYLDLIERHVENVWGSKHDADFWRLVSTEGLRHASIISEMWRTIEPEITKYTYTQLTQGLIDGRQALAKTHATAGTG